ncbi:SDR family NAD(P)-dependent oxidoreductase [Plebeiibacterium sediminum]|uniref:SDR family oxidoreductase n=1 Tax=Plebeiibacterium sediminum TaxID=2992112 RepID=A0AAE3M1S2_9BACT|nr:SDR family oxidoreductase [Plebeiobacterium sediminum]MCW3785155.1 SDR family oxidoreductase [Plebeiobacterium sediminum]
MKYAFVTGSTKGIGKAIGIKLLQEGYHVVFNYCNSEESARELYELLQDSYNGMYNIIKADLSDIDSVQHVSEQLRDIVPYLNTVVFNAGITDRSVFGEINPDNWLRVFNANLNIPFFLMQELVPSIKTGGNIIFIGSMLGNLPHSVSTSYGVSKSAVHALVKNMVKFLSKDNITINAIAPGFVDTDWQKEKPEWLREKIKGKVALKRFASEVEVADLCFNIIQTPYLTGQIIQLDGGYNYE